MIEIDRRLAEWAGDHFGIVSLEEARACGATGKHVWHRARGGVLVPLHRGVFRHSAAPPSWEGRLRAALLAAGPNAVASHHSAARLYGWRGVYDDVPEVTVVGTRRPQVSGVRVHRLDRLDPFDRTRRFGLPCLAPPLALLGLGARASPRTVHNAVHDAVHLRQTTVSRLVDVLNRTGGRGRRGTAMLRDALAGVLAVGGATETGLELDLVRLLRAGGLPDPEVQLRVIDGNGEIRRLDVAYSGPRIDLDTDGDRWHSSALDRSRDRRRDAALEAVGYEVHRLGSHDIHQWPDRTVRRVRDSLARRGSFAHCSLSS
jgi:very-short-patch-repair endonuclease